MAGPKKWTEAVVQRRLREGRGQGEGEDFTPWQYVQEFSSSGTQTRISPLTQLRTLHLFSYIERWLFLYLEFYLRPQFYREQLAMDRRVTMGAAAALGIRYPRYPVTQVPVVMTLDAVTSTADLAGRVQVVAYDCKPDSHLKDRRTLEKLALHKAYCSRRGWPHHIFTEKTLPRAVVRNLDWLRSGPQKEGETEIAPGLFCALPQLMLQEISARRPAQSIRHYCAQFDRTHGLERGTGLRVFKVLVWRRDLKFDLAIGDAELQIVPVPGHQPNKLARRVA